MRLAYVCVDPGVPVFGSKGCSIHVQEVVRALLRKGVVVELHAARLGGAPPPGLEGVRTFRLPRFRGQDPGARELACIEANDDLRSALEGRPRYDAVYERHSLWGTAGMDFARAMGIPGILEVNAPLVEEQASHRRLVHRDAAERSVRRAFDGATLLIAVSKSVAAHLRRFPDTRERIHVVANGVDPKRFRPRPEASLRSTSFTAGFVGSLKPWHDLSTLVGAFDILHRRHFDARLLVVGDGPERERLLDRLEGRGLKSSACLTGAVAPAEVPRWMERMDVGIAPYPGGECYFSPLKIFEYMAAGLPIVASRIGQIPELIEHEQTGLLCEPGDAESLAEALCRLRADPDLRVLLGANARAAALREHSWDRAVSRLLDLADLGSPAPARSEDG